VPEKDPATYSWLTYAWVSSWAAMGGLVSYIRKVREGKARCFNFTELVGELVTSAFVGIGTFWICEYADLDPLLTAALIGICGHMGSRVIFLGEELLNQRLEGWIKK